MGNSRFLESFHPQIPLNDSHAHSLVHPSEPGIQQQNARGEVYRHSNQPVYAPNLSSFASAMSVSQSNAPSFSPSQALDRRYPFPNITPQQIMFGEWYQPYIITPLQAVPTGCDQFPRGR